MIIHAMNHEAAATNLILDGIAPVPHLGVIRVAGADAASFLQGQLTQDFLSLPAAEARLAAFCSAKGRMQASFVGIRADNDILLVCSRDILPATLKRLSMFVLRAKANLSDASAEFTLLGVAGDTIKSIAAYVYSTRANGLNGSQFLVKVPPAALFERALWLAPLGATLPAGPALSADHWRWGEVMSGVATITAPIADLFVPQMLNYESVGGVNFKKGCYPGQEVVARSQFRGTLKRRAYLVHSISPMAAGDEVFAPGDDTQPCGTVAQAAQTPAGPSGDSAGFHAIVSMQVSAALAGGLTLGAPSGPRVELLALPYALLDDI
jgi:tRNA-modifying protein YgfZ